MNQNNRKTSDQRDNESSNRMKKKNPTAADLYDQEFPPLTASASISTNISSTNRFRSQSTASNENKKQEGTARALSRQPTPLVLQNFYQRSTTQTTPTNEYFSSNRPISRNSRGQSYGEQKSERIESINTELANIIANIHLHKEYPSVARIEQELFANHDVQSFRELGIDKRDLNVLMNHIHRDKDVTFYMQVFEQIFNLCSLHDLGPLISKFLKLNTYEDAHLGPLDEHPAVKRVFRYKPKKRHQPIPEITSGDIISAFIEFQDRYQRRRFDYQEFLDELVEKYQLEKREELGLFCKSFPYLTEVTRKLTREWNMCKKRIESDTNRRIINEVEKKLREIQLDVSSQLEPSSYTNKSPIAVFDHLATVIDKYLIVAQQKAIRDLLTKIRNDELLRCLLSISIYLGSMDKPEKFLVEFQKLTQSQTSQNENSKSASAVHQSANSNQSLNNNGQQMNSQNVSNAQNVRSGGNLSSTINNISFGNLSSASDEIKPLIPLSNICSELGNIFSRYDSVLTIKQIYEIKNHLCKKYSVKNFSEFRFNDDDDDDENNYLDIISFIHKYRPKIDAYGGLSVYDYISSKSDRQDIYTFVNQLAVIKNWREKQDQNENSSHRKIFMSNEQSLAVERALQYKFPGSIGNNQVFQILNKANTLSTKNTRPVIYYEESLLDDAGLSRLGICPPSVLVDESQLCQIILQCPIMTDLLTWVQWTNYFQLRYGPLKTFIARKQQELDRLLLLETSNHELLRLPKDPSFDNFQKELYSGNIRSSVGHLCALTICEYVTINHFPVTMYKQVITTWLVRIRSAYELNPNGIEPMRYILEFLTYLPVLIGQSRIIHDVLLESIDRIFDNDEENLRQRIWILANAKQRSKLETWGHLLDIDEWKNENKWKGIDEPQEEPMIQFTFEQFRQQTNIPTKIQEIAVPQTVQASVPTTDVPSTPSVSETRIPVTVDRNLSNNNQNITAHELIKAIVKNLGINNSLDETGKSIVNTLHGLLERSLEKLSNDLFSEQGHFVLELMQNADDNQYPSDCLPTLRFVISSERILVCNNEIGFQSNHIEAICNVGKSTKGKHKEGYAGHKGIGFKSVFMISDRPEIHSRDYHFCFDTKNGTDQMDYIRPIWLDQFEESLPSSDEWRTCIRLPIKQEKRTDRLKRNFDDIHARLLLFLNRLRQIEIIREKGNDQKEFQIFTRIDHAQGQIIELQKKTSTSEQVMKSFWLVVKTVIQIPINIKIQFSDIKCSAESTTISIAYPLDHIHDMSSYEKLLTQPLFAYLPLRSFGFRFILQGDFEVPATREDVLRDNAWNEWLKKEMVRLLPLAYEFFKSLSDILKSCSIDVQNHFREINLIEAMKFFMKTIPIHNGIDPYFNSFIDKSIEGLMGVIQLPVIINEINQTVQWVSPTQCVFVRDSFIKQIFTQDLLLSHFNSYYLSEEFVNECDQSILIKLGCRKLDFSNILRLIRSLYSQNEQEHTTKTTSIEQIAQWFLCINYSLQQEREKPGFTFDDDNEKEETTIEQIKQLKIIPLHNQTQLVSIEQFKDRAILFPLDKSTPYPKYIRLVYEDLPTIDGRLLDYIEKKYPHRLESITSLLKDLGISHARNVRRMYSNHIFPILSDISQWSTKRDSVLIAYVIFIYRSLYFDKPDHFASEMEKLKNTLIIKVRQGKFIRISSNGPNIVHLTPTYGCKMSLDLLKLPTDQFTFISDDYYKEYYNELFNKAEERTQFIYFLNELGIYDFFLIKKLETKFFKVEQLVGTKWNHIVDELSQLVFEPFTILDSSCDEFDTVILSKENVGIDQYSKILLYLDYCFQPTSNFYASSVIRSRERYEANPAPILAVESSFCLSLKKHSWIPVIGGQLYKPTDVYYLPLDNPFSRYVPCLDQSKVPLKNQDFIKLLGFKLKILPKTMFELFMKWSCNLDTDSLWNLTKDETVNIIPCTISTTTHQSCRDTIYNISQIYQCLAADQDIKTHLSRFHQWPLIFIPRTADIGEFLFTKEVFWHDPESLLTFGNTVHYQSIQHIALKTYYGNNPFFQNLFVNVFQVKQHPTLEDYLPLLNNLIDKNIEYIWKCIRVITSLAFAQNKQTIVKDQCHDWSFIPCVSYTHKLVKYTDQPYYPHDTAVADLFADIIPIIKLSNDVKRSNEFKQQFCTLFNIDDLSDVIQNVIDVENPQQSEGILEFYSNSIDLIQYFLLINRYISETQSNHLQTIFSEMTFISVDAIYLSYRYKENVRRKLASSSLLDSYIDESTRKFYILKKYEKSESRFIYTMVNYLVQDEANRLKLSYYIQTLLRIYQDEGLDGLNKRRENLPEQQLPKWNIPRVIKKEPSVSSSDEDEDEDEVNNDSVSIPKELLEEIINEPDRRLLKQNTNILVDPNQPKTLTCFPAKPGPEIRTEASNTTNQLTSAPKNINTKPQIPTQKNPNSIVSTTQSTGHKTVDVNNQTTEKKTVEQVKSSENKQSLGVTHQSGSNASVQSTKPQITPVKIGNFLTSSGINFEKIRISTITNLTLSSEAKADPSTSTNVASSNNEIDTIIGRRGEELVYKYLQWKYPNEKIEWINEHSESGRPFDIRMTHNQTQNQATLIEVKTTRSSTQNTFRISIGEIECLMENQNNYHIYRVYYDSNDVLSSTIIILNQIKHNLQQKQLELSMRIPLQNQ